MWTTTLGDKNGYFYTVEVQDDGSATAKETYGSFTLNHYEYTAGQDPQASDFRREGERICNAIAEGRHVLGHKRSEA